MHRACTVDDSCFQSDTLWLSRISTLEHFMWHARHRHNTTTNGELHEAYAYKGFPTLLPRVFPGIHLYTVYTECSIHWWGAWSPHNRRLGHTERLSCIVSTHMWGLHEREAYEYKGFPTLIHRVFPAPRGLSWNLVWSKSRMRHIRKFHWAPQGLCSQMSQNNELPSAQQLLHSSTGTIVIFSDIFYKVKSWWLLGNWILIIRDFDHTRFWSHEISKNTC